MTMAANPTHSPHHAAALTAAADSVKAATAKEDANKVNCKEVGWLFVQEYYTFLNKEPHKLHCFYDSKSSFIHGTEGEQFLEPEHGQKEIHNRIVQLDFQDCKVLVSNVDSQSSHDGCIVIMVLGEMSNKGGPSHKFCQCFVLAEQPAGYFVYNDIFRFLKEDIDNEYEEPLDPMPETSYSAYTNGVSHAVPEVTLEPPVREAPAPVTRARSPSPVKEPVAAPAKPTPPPAAVAAAPAPTTAAQQADEWTEPTKPVASEQQQQQPAVTPAPVQQQHKPNKSEKKKEVHVEAAPAAAPATPAGPPKPKTWANLAASSTPGAAAASQPAAASVPAPSAAKPPLANGKGGPSEASKPANNYQKNQQNRRPQQNSVNSAGAGSEEQHGDGGFTQVRRTGSDRKNNRNNNNNTSNNNNNNQNNNNTNGTGSNQNNQRQQHNEETFARSIFFPLQKGLNEENIKETFDKVGKVLDVIIPKGKNLVFVEFDSVQAAQSAIGNPFTVNGLTVTPDVRKARAQNNNNRYENRNHQNGQQNRQNNNENWSHNNNHHRRNQDNQEGKKERQQNPKPAPTQASD